MPPARPRPTGTFPPTPRGRPGPGARWSRQKRAERGGSRDAAGRFLPALLAAVIGLTGLLACSEERSSDERRADRTAPVRVPTDGTARGTEPGQNGPDDTATPGTDRAGTKAERAWIRRTIAGMTRREKVGQLFVNQVYGATAGTADPRNTETYGVATPAEAVATYHLGGVAYFTWSDNVEHPRQVTGLSNGLQRAAESRGAGVPLLISTDQEQGTINRIGPPVTQFPGNMALGATRDPGSARRAAAVTGRELRALGINQDYAPVADVNVNPGNPVIGVRSFGSDPELVKAMTTAQVAGLERDAGVAATVKHFPGHGDTAVDSHTGLPVITHSRGEWERLDAPPFRAAIRAGVDAIMTGHLVFPALDPSGDPATLSRPVLTGILREELGYDGVVITDALTMRGVREKYGDDRVPVLALKAGADLLLQPPDFRLAYDAVLGAVRDGEIGKRRLHGSLTRILRLKWRNGIVADPYVTPARVEPVVGSARHRAAANRVAEQATTVVDNQAGLLPLSPDGRDVLVTGYGQEATRTLAAGLERRGGSTTVYPTGADPDADRIAEAVRRARRADITVLLTMRAWADDNAGQRRLVEELSRAGTRLVAVATAEPQDLADAAEADAAVATYTSKPVGLRALVKVLTGEVRARGRLPVPISAPDSEGD